MNKLIMQDYGDPEYWERRYADRPERTFDWLEEYESLSPLIDRYVKKTHRILMLGCGNSELSEQMYMSGYRNIFNMDISSVVIKQMSIRNADKKEMRWEVMDARKLEYADEFFDVVIDKSTLDAILCGDFSFYNAAKVTNEVQRVLKDKGVYLVITYGKPYTRVFHFQRPHLDFKLDTFVLRSKTEIGEPTEHFCYVAIKGPSAKTNSDEHFHSVLEGLLSHHEQEKKQQASLHATKK